MKNFVGTTPLGFLKPIDSFPDKGEVMLDTLIFGSETPSEVITIEPVKDMPSEPMEDICPDVPLPAPPPCQKYEAYFEEGQKCPSYRLVRDAECPDQTFEQPFEVPTESDTTSFPNWPKLNCLEVKIALEGLNQTLMTSRLTQTELSRYQQQIAIGESILQKNCGKLMETTYVMMNWKSIDCELIPSAINDLNYMIAQGQGNDADLDLMRKDVMVGQEFYKANCEKTLETPPGGGLVTLDDLFGTGGIKTAPAETAPVAVQTPTTPQTSDQTADVVSMGPAKKNYVWIYVAAAVGAFLLLTRRK